MPFRAAANNSLTDAPTLSRNLKRLLQMRSILILCQAALVLLSFLIPGVHLQLWPMLAVIVTYTAVNLVSIRMLHSQEEISEQAYFAQLILDVLFLTVLLYLSGGYTNPFISLYLLPLIIVSSTLPRAYAWSMATLVLVCYSLLVFFYWPLFGMQQGHMANGFHLHLVGMWFSFILSVSLIVFFVMRMSDALRERERHLADMREKSARDELVVSLGALAAGAAHELGTPLATMAVVVGELGRTHADNPEQIKILKEQLQRCKEILSQISASAGAARAEEGRSLPVDAYLLEVLEQWQSTRPETDVAVDMATGSAPRLVADVTLTQALFNILNNAADASPARIELACRWSGDGIVIEVCDEGAGLPDGFRHQLGAPFVSTKSGGRGLGLFLSQAVIERLGGSLTLADRQPHGACARIALPGSIFVATGAA